VSNGFDALVIDRSTLLRSVLDQLDIPEDLYEKAVSKYDKVGDWLSQHFEAAGTSGCDIYTQGSFRLGTVVRPIGRDEYDIDLVCLRHLSRNSITQHALKRQVGDALELYVEAAPNSGASGPRERQRCWTLEYRKEQFHLDVLPSVPDDDGEATGILLTDRDLRHWQHGDPIGYADWFYDRMSEEFVLRRTRIAARLGAQIEEVPAWRVKTTLQGSVQFLKRHRDVAFLDDPDNRPVSIIITTLAARAYTGSGELIDVIQHIAQLMHEFIERRDGVWWVANPVQPEENFADKWNTHPERRRKFFAWLDAVRSDLEALVSETTPHGVVRNLTSMLGEGPVHVAARAAGLSVPAPSTPSSVRRRDTGEEFIEDTHPVDLRYSVTLNGKIQPKDGFRHGNLRSFANRVGKHRSLVFNVVKCNVPQPYEILWKIKNTGEEAARLGQLRGSIFQGGHTHHESTLYTGDHYAECYIIKDGLCVAADRQPVIIP